jgi:8-oxo-dGTP diphosphatase
VSPAQERIHTATLAVSTVIFALSPNAQGDLALSIPLVRRIRAPFDGMWALPGGPLASDEDLDAAAARNLAETTGLEPKYLEQLYAFGNVDRSDGHIQAERVVSIVYWALVGSQEVRQAIQDQNVQWFSADALPELAFDHNVIVGYALNRLRNKIEYARIAHGFLGETFTLAQLREVYEAVLGRALDPGNFRRTVEASGEIVPTGRRLMGTKHRPPQLYQYKRDSPTPFSDENQEKVND